jgi:hypothetical protein
MTKTNRPGLVRRIYAELRLSAAPGESSADLLRAAAEIAAIFIETSEGSGGRAGYRTGGVPFEAWGVDRAMADGGWRLLRVESELVRATLGEGCREDEFAVDQWLQENVA